MGNVWSELYFHQPVFYRALGLKTNLHAVAQHKRAIFGVVAFKVILGSCNALRFLQKYDFSAIVRLTPRSMLDHGPLVSKVSTFEHL